MADPHKTAPAPWLGHTVLVRMAEHALEQGYSSSILMRAFLVETPRAGGTRARRRDRSAREKDSSELALL